MTTDEVKAYLRQYRYLSLKIDGKLDELAKLRALSENVTRAFSGNASAGGRTSDKVGRGVANIVALEKKINTEIEKLCKSREEIEKTIDALPDEKERIVLRYYYINGLSWEQTAEKLGISVRHTTRLHGFAILKISKMKS